MQEDKVSAAVLFADAHSASNVLDGGHARGHDHQFAGLCSLLDEFEVLDLKGSDLVCGTVAGLKEVHRILVKGR